MKVDNSIKKLGESPIGELRARPRNGVEKARSTGVESDSVQLSTVSARLQAPDGQIAGGGVFDANTVEEIKLAIAEGRFEVNPEKIADGLMATVKDLLQARRL